IQGLISKRFIEIAPRLSSRVPGIPEAVDDALAAALALDPAERPAGASAFARSLSGATNTIERSATTARPAAVSVTPTGAVTTTTLGVVTDPALPSVAVLPFANLSSDVENEFL